MPGGGSPLTMRYKLRQSNHTISPLDQSLASALRMEFHTFPNPIFELLTAAQRPGGVLRGGRLEIGAGRNDPDRSGIDFAVSASPEPVLSYLSCRHKKDTRRRHPFDRFFRIFLAGARKIPLPTIPKLKEFPGSYEPGNIVRGRYR